MDFISAWFPVLLSAHAQVAEQAGGGTPWFVTVAVFIGMLVVLVFVHELGHFLMALWMGIRVEEFGIGFPPRAATLFRHRGVDYTLNWLPLGGFVRFGGDDTFYSSPSKEKQEHDAPPDARADSEADAPARSAQPAERTDPQDSNGTMTLAEASPWRRIPVMVAGPFANLLTAVVIFAVLFTIVGIPEPTEQGQVLGDVFPNTPAAEAGMESGDILRSLDGQVATGSEVIEQVATDNAGQPIPAVVEREGDDVTLTIVPGPWETAEGVEREVGFGFSYVPEVENINVNPFEAIGASVVRTWDILVTMWNGLGQMVGGLLGFNEPPPGGVAGPVGIARATGEVIDASGMIGFWNWMAIISLNLFLLNLLPIPALDGSHIVFALLEIARRGKKVPPEKEAMVHAIGFFTLMGLIVIVTFFDVTSALQNAPVIPGQ